MTHMSNPTSSSAVVGQRVAFGSGRAARIAKDLTVPALLAAFAAYLLVGILTMQVPADTSFPGPRFFPGLVTAALAIIATLLVVRTARTRRAEARAADAPARPETQPVVLGTDAVAVADTAAAHAASADDAGEERGVRVDVRSLAWVVLSFAGFALLLDVLGWIVAAGLLFAGVARGLGAVGIVRPIVVGLTVSSLSYIAFDMLLELSLPSGIIGWGF